MSSIPYAARIKIPELFEREKAQLTELSIYRDGAQVIPTSGTYTLLKPDGTKIRDSVAVTVTGAGTLQYTHIAGDFPSTLNLGEGYLQEWTAVIDSVSYTFRRIASLVLRRLYPVVSDIDLTATYSDLEDLRPSSLSSFQQYIDEAWFVIIQRLRTSGGGYEYLVMSPESFRACHIDLSLYYIFRDFHSSLGNSTGRYLELAQEHHSQYEKGFLGINMIYDSSHENKTDDPDRRRSLTPTIFTQKPAAYAYRRRLNYR
jgi:hypothetical protein